MRPGYRSPRRAWGDPCASQVVDRSAFSASRFWSFLMGDQALGQSPPAPVRHIRVGELLRTYLLDRFHADQAQGRLPIAT